MRNYIIIFLWFFLLTQAKLSETFEATVGKAVLHGLDFYKFDNGTECAESLLRSLDEGELFAYNVSQAGEEPFTKMDPYLNISQMMSSSVRDTFLRCPLAGLHYGQHMINHYKQFENATLGETVESLLFGFLGNSFSVRTAYQRIKRYDELKDDAGIVLEIVKLLRKFAFFDNIYAKVQDTNTLISEQDKFNQTKAWLEDPKPAAASTTSDPNWMSNYDMYMPAAFIEGPYRFADYFQAYSHAQECKHSVQKQEAKMLYLIDNQFNNATAGLAEEVKSFSEALGSFFGLMSRSVSQCGYSIRDEILQHNTYLTFDNTENILKSVKSLLEQDDRVYYNVVQMINIFNRTGHTIHLQAAPHKQLKSSKDPQYTDANVNYRNVGWYLGDTLARLILN